MNKKVKKALDATKTAERQSEELTKAVQNLFQPGTVLYNILEDREVVEVTSADKNGTYRTMIYKFDLFDKIMCDIMKARDKKENE